MRTLTTLTTIAALGGVLLITACGAETDLQAELPEAGEPVAAKPAQEQDLPPIVLQEGDGLPATLPTDLVWETNDEDPIFADPKARRGGTYRSFMLSFPITLRSVGPDSNGSIAGYLRSNQLGLVDHHPQTRRPIPALATHWAFGADGRNIYYRLNPKARWSDGEPMTADDFVFALRFYRSKAIVGPWYNTHYTERIRDVKRYDDYTIGIQGAEAKPREEMLIHYGMGPRASHFHVLSDTWVQDNNWKIEPNTGPYQISKVEKGRYIEWRRKSDWWANDLKYFQHRFNPDKIRRRVIRDLNVAFQHFLKGELDAFGLTRPKFWHEKATGEAFDAGYIFKYWFYNELPVSPSGMYLNTADPIIADQNVRYGLAHAMNFERVIKTVLRGDYERLQTFQRGYGVYDNRDISAREFDLEKAAAYFAKAGFVERGADGILVKDGQRLSLRVTYGLKEDTERLVILQEDARKAGVDLKLQLLDWVLSFKKMREKKHQIAWMSWTTASFPRYWGFFHSVNANKTQTNNLANYSDPLMDELIMQYRASSDVDERTQLAHRLEQMIHDSGVVIPSFHIPYVREGAWRWLKLPAWLGTRTSSGLFNPLAYAGIFSSGGLFWIDEEEKARTLATKDEGGQFEPTTVINTDYRRS